MGRHRVPGWGGRSALVVLATVCALGVATVARAQSSQSGKDITFSVNYVYAAQLGFGTYSVGGLSVNVYSLPLAYTLRDVLFDWRLKIEFPILYGDYSVRKTVVLDDGGLEGTPVKILADQRTLSAEPKLKLEIPVLEPWTISLIGAWGFGSTFDTDFRGRELGGQTVRFRDQNQNVWYYTYQAGISSLLQHQVDRLTLSLGNAFIYAGSNTLEGPQGVEAYGAIETGTEARHPLGFDVGGYAPDASLFFIWYWFTPSLEFTRVEKRSLRVDNVYEVGVSFGADQGTPFEIPVLGNPRLGISYRVGNDLNAVRMNFGFPF